MKLAIMQPYFFPYIGYWQLMNAVDHYIVFNDVNYINRGWVNRNRILCQGEPMYIHLLLSKASQNKKINEIDVIPDEKHTAKLLRTLESCYKKAPHFEEAFGMASRLLTDNREQKLDRYLYRTMQGICEYLGIHVPMSFSSELEKDNSLHGEAKIIDICKRMGADQYCNAAGGRALYAADHFQSENIRLLFLKTGPIRYRQFQNPFQENLSVLDMMMFCSKDEIQGYLSMCSLAEPQDPAI